MNWQQDEPKVIDEEMLKQAIEEQGPQGQAGDISKKEGVQYEDVLQLRLDYRNILKIYHLWHFTSLTKLQLDNNVIERIEGLKNLTNLVWLDLSFNNIQVIEGLNSLVKLKDLSLFNNRISVIENLDSLRDLHVLSFGNNAIAQLENRETAYTKYKYAIEGMQENELQEQQAIEAQKISNEELQLHKDAFVEFLNGPQLYDSMFDEDPDGEKLALLPGMEELLESFKSKMEALCVQIFDAGLTQHAQRTAEVESFFSCSHEAVADNRQKAAQIAADFESSRRQKILEMQQITDVELLEDHISLCQEQASQLSETLLSLELQLVDQLEDIFKDFERSISDMVGGFIEYVQGIFAQCRDLENQHHEQQLEIALATLEKVVKNELEEEIPDDMAMLLVDKDTVTNAVSASHDIHLLKIDNREDELLTRINSWMSGLLKSIHDEEVKRNRKRTSEIRNYVSYVKDELEDMRLSEHH
ncbi:dynein regulatory complex subunit 3 isoform X2 [Carassius auratus]|uniref:Dynein regulatory complex subunit 3 n=1 Tax=Carassius auratus TaxID=7957 RepID=A0A6P6JYU2_CARAU|nr:dynein regulatory complex subunit 3 isoform X2 [Carassius auratus]